MAIPLEPSQLHGHDRFVRRVALSLVQDDATADDLVQDAWLVALEHRGEISCFRTWMRAVIRLLALGHHRKQGSRRCERLHDGLRSSEPEPEPDEVADVLREALQSLDEDFAVVLRLHHLEELSVAEVARRLDVPVTTVKSRLFRARGSLRDVLDRRYSGQRILWSTALIGAFDWSRADVAPAGSLASAGALGAALAVASAAACVLWLGGTAVAPIAGPRTASVEAEEPELVRQAEVRRAVAPRLERGARAGRRVVEPPAEAPREAAHADARRAAPEATVPLVRFQVLAPDGRAVEGARVLGANGFVAVTDADGLAHVELGADDAERGRPRPRAVYAVAPGHAVSPWREPTWSAGATCVLRVGGPDFVLTGSVIDTLGRPVEGVRVRRAAGLVEPSAVELETRTDEHGTFTLAHLPRTASTILAEKSGHAPTTVVVDGSYRASEDVVLALSGGTEIQGVVVDEHGLPVEGARVHFGRSPEPRDASPVRTDRDGRFALAHCAPGVARVWATAATGTASVELTTQGRERLDVRLTLAPEERCRARLVDPDGRPLRATTFVLRSFSDDRVSWSARVPVDSSGRVVFEHHGAGAVYGYALDEDAPHALPLGWARWDEPSDEERTIVCDARGESGARVRGLLLDASGRPVSHGETYLTHVESRAALRVSTDPEGGFELTGVPEGSYRLAFVVPRAGRWGDLPVEVEDPRELELGAVRLPPAGTLRIDCAWPRDGEHTLGLFERVASVPDPADGRAWRPVFRVPSWLAAESVELLPGTYRLAVEHRGRFVQGRTFRVRSERRVTTLLGPGDPPAPVTIDVAGLDATGELGIEVFRIDDLALADGELGADARERVRRRGRGEEVVGRIGRDGVLRGETLLGQGRWCILIRTPNGETGYVASLRDLDWDLPSLSWGRRRR